MKVWVGKPKNPMGSVVGAVLTVENPMTWAASFT
jgi:hypothetical protein